MLSTHSNTELYPGSFFSVYVAFNQRGCLEKDAVDVDLGARILTA